VIRLYARGRWEYADADRSDGYSVVLFGRHGHYRHPPGEAVQQALAIEGVSSVQITFHEDKHPALHAMPPGGFRLAIVNAHSLQAGMAARDLLRAALLCRSA
jgi:hypothetical protein